MRTKGIVAERDRCEGKREIGVGGEGLCMCMRVEEGRRQKDTERGRQRDRHTDIQKDTERGRQTDRQTDRHTNRDRVRQRNILCRSG